MDPQQRYCVNCAARRGNGANPVLALLRGDEQTRPPADGAPAGESPGQPGGGGRLLRAAADRGRDRRRRRPRRLGRRRRRRAAARRCAEQDAVAATSGPTTAATATTAKKAKKAAKASGKQPAKGQGKVVAADQQRHRPPVHRLQAERGKGSRRHPAGRRKPRTGRLRLHQSPAEPPRRDRRRRRPERSPGAAERKGQP